VKAYVSTVRGTCQQDRYSCIVHRVPSATSASSKLEKNSYGRISECTAPVTPPVLSTPWPRKRYLPPYILLNPLHRPASRMTRT
jgi:hypothetical protein